MPTYLFKQNLGQYKRSPNRRAGCYTIILKSYMIHTLKRDKAFVFQLFKVRGGNTRYFFKLGR